MKKIIFFYLLALNTKPGFSDEKMDKIVVKIQEKPIPSKPIDSAGLCGCARKWIKKARMGDVVAMTELARCYLPSIKTLMTDEQKLEGFVCTPHSELRAAWLGAAASRGFAPAQYEYGMLYLYGDGVAVDRVNASNWLTLSASKGYPLAYFTLGEIYQFGLGRPKNRSKAIKNFEAAAKLGDPRAKDRIDEIKADINQ